MYCIQVKEMLSKEDQIRYFKNLKTETDKEKIKIMEKELFLTYYRFVLKLAKSVDFYYLKIINYEDMCSVGSNGLLKAIRSYDIDKKVSFCTYAAICIKNEIGIALRKNKKTKIECSLQEPVFSNKNGDSVIREDTIRDKKDMLEDYVDEDEIKYQKNLVKKVLTDNKILTDREKKVLVLRFGLGYCEPHRAKDVASALNISQSYATRIEQSAILKIRKEINRVKLEKDNFLE